MHAGNMYGLPPPGMHLAGAHQASGGYLQHHLHHQHQQQQQQQNHHLSPSPDVANALASLAQGGGR
jgi:hypothetical protein